jgi:hypothetical protein
MLKQYLKYLSKFGSVRIVRYANNLIDRFNFNNLDIDVILDLPYYYKDPDDERMIEFIRIINLNNLWYTLYL